MIFIDHGECTFSVYGHHRSQTATVKLGALVNVGTRLAQVGKTGTIGEHLHFDVRGCDWETTHPVMFADKTGSPIEIAEGYQYESATPEDNESNSKFEDSLLTTNCFKANGILLSSYPYAHMFHAGKEMSLKGKVVGSDTRVYFCLWNKNVMSKSINFSCSVERSGDFTLRVFIPEHLGGCFWYRIGCNPRAGRAILPVWVH